MINYNTYKKVYTAGDMFTLTGADFHGFVQTVNGSGREVSTGKLLVPKNTYATDLFLSIDFTDRVVSDTNIKLPNNLDDCLFNLNDNLNYDLFKLKLNSLRENNTYVYSRLFIASNKLPYTDSIQYASVASNTVSSFSINTSDANNPQFVSNVKFANNHYLSAFGYIVGATAQTNLDYDNHFSLFACTSSDLICLTGSDSDLTIIEDTTGYETTDENNLSFKELGGIASTKEHLYLSDTGNNVVLKYNVAGYVNNDSILRNTRHYLELVGGYGDTTRQTKFLRPTKLAVDENHVAVFDSGNKVIKIFDDEFNYITRISSINFNVEVMGAMGFDPDFRSLYILTYEDVVVNNTTSRKAYLYRYSGTNFKFSEKIVLEDQLASDEKIIDISFSGTDSNYWYFATNKTVYKKFKTRPSKVIGKYRSERLYLLNFTDKSDNQVSINNRWNFTDIHFSQSNFVWNLGTQHAAAATLNRVDGLLDSNITSFSTFQSTSGYDKTIMLTDGRLYFFNEPILESYQRVLKDTNYTNYGIEGFSLNTDGFIQQSVINIELNKLITDTLTLKNNIVGKFSGKYVNNILELDNYNYNLDFNKFITSEIENFYIHGNEENLIGVLNRCFKLLYEVQEKLVNFVQPDISNNIQPSYTINGIIEI